jgi:hypothetical protein
MYIRIDGVFARRSEKQVCVLYVRMYVCMWQSFIMNSSVGSSVGASSMRAADLQALKNFKKRKADNVRVFDYLLVVVVVCAGLVACFPHGRILNTIFFFMHV